MGEIIGIIIMVTIGMFVVAAVGAFLIFKVLIPLMIKAMKKIWDEMDYFFDDDFK